MSVGGGLVKRVLLLAKAAVDFRNDLPVERSQPGFDEARHIRGSSVSGGFSQTGLDPLQRLDAFTFQIALARSRQHRLGDKTVLNPERIFHDPFQPLLLRLCHAGNIANPARPRKPKISCVGICSIAPSHFPQ